MTSPAQAIVLLHIVGTRATEWAATGDDGWRPFLYLNGVRHPSATLIVMVSLHHSGFSLAKSKREAGGIRRRRMSVVTRSAKMQDQVPASSTSGNHIT